jgi:hypothetical protein
MDKTITRKYYTMWHFHQKQNKKPSKIVGKYGFIKTLRKNCKHSKSKVNWTEPPIYFPQSTFSGSNGVGLTNNHFVLPIDLCSIQKCTIASLTLVIMSHVDHSLHLIVHSYFVLLLKVPIDLVVAFTCNYTSSKFDFILYVILMLGLFHSTLSYMYFAILHNSVTTQAIQLAPKLEVILYFLHSFLYISNTRNIKPLFPKIPCATCTT